MEYYIYKTTNLINGKQYIGQHYGKINDSYLGSGTLILKAIEKYGKNSFYKEVLEICQSREDANEKEKFYISLYNAVENENFYNLADGNPIGSSWKYCHKWAKENPEKAKELYKKNGEKLQQWVKENPEKAKENIQKCIEGSKKWKEENPEKVKEIMKKVNESKIKWQKEHEEEYKKQIKQWREKGTITNSQQIRCITTGEIFPSQSAAARAYNIPQSNISKCLKGERKSAGKHPITKEKLLWELVK